MVNNRKIFYWGLAFLFVVSLVLGGAVLFLSKDDGFKVSFLDVGQGDSILISAGSNQMLVDGGENRKILLEKLGTHIPFWDRKIEVLVLTHPDKDHLAGLLSVLQNYEVETVVVTGYESGTKFQLAWEKLIKKEGAAVVEAVQGTKIKISDELSVDVLHPFFSVDVSKKRKSNNHSVVLKLDSNQKDFLLTGDISKTEEREMIEKGIDLKADVLKVAHHGSKNSSGKNFLSAVGAHEAVVSSGKDNRYGHPHEETIQGLVREGVEVLRTDQNGDVVYECESSGCRVMKN